MEFKTISGVTLPVLGAGTWHMGGMKSTDRANDRQEIAALRKALFLGATHIDTAELYGNGHAEELVARAIQGMKREDLFIATKVKGDNLASDKLLSAAAGSLSRLKTDYIDLYLLHWPNPSVDREDTMKALDQLVEEGKVRHVGVSNFSVTQMREAQSLTKNKILTNQVEYNILNRNEGEFLEDVEKKVLPYCQENDIFLTAYRPLAQGTLAAHPALSTLAKKYQKTPAQIAIRWLLDKKNVITIPKAARIEHVKENVGSLGWTLEKEDNHFLDNGL